MVKGTADSYLRYLYLSPANIDCIRSYLVVDPKEYIRVDSSYVDVPTRRQHSDSPTTSTMLIPDDRDMN